MKVIEGPNERDRARSRRPRVRQAERRGEVVPNGIVGTPRQPPNETRQPVGIGIVDDRPGVHAVSDFMAKI